MSNTKHKIVQFVFPGSLCFIGLICLMLSMMLDQNSLFVLGAISILLCGIISVANTAGMITKQLSAGLVAGLILLAFFIAYQDFRSIKDPVDFLDAKQYRQEFVIQRLKDIRTAELAFKSEKGQYAGNFKELMHFLTNDSLTIVKKLGMVPDTLTEVEAWVLNIITRDTFRIPVAASIFAPEKLVGRDIDFELDSLPYIPFGNGVQFALAADIIDKGNGKVNVFRVDAFNENMYHGLDTRWYKKGEGLSVGSMTEPTTTGNWGE